MKFDEVMKRMDNPGGINYLGQILESLANIPKIENRVAVLKKFAAKNQANNKALLIYAQAMWHPKAIMDLPEGEPPYKTGEFTDYDHAPSSLIREMNKLPYWIKGSPSYIANRIKREQIFMQAIESMYVAESKILIALKDKNEKAVKNATKAVFAQVFPTADWLQES